MDSASMDDKLYYVEGLDGKVLGPMNMIQILEGIAAGAILDSARICEVGRNEWVDLSEVAYTHHEEPTAERHVPSAQGERPDVAPTPTPPEPVSAIDFGLADLEPTPEEAELDFQIPDPTPTPTPPQESTVLETPVPEAGLTEVPAPAEAPVLFEASPDALEPFDPTPLPTPVPAADPTPVAAEETAVPTASFSEDVPQDRDATVEMPTPTFPQDATDEMPASALPEGEGHQGATQELPAAAFPEDANHGLPASAFPEGHELPASAFPEDAGHGLPASAFPEGHELPASAFPEGQDLPASAFPEEGPRDLPASAFPSEGPGAGAGDFQLEMAGPEDELEEEVEAAAAAPRSRKWIAPVAVALALPILAGIYHLAGGPSPFSKPDEENPGNATATVTRAEAPTLTDEAWTALREGKLQRALQRFNVAIGEDPDDARAHHGRGLTALRLGDTSTAIRSLERSLELDAASAQVRTDLGRAHLAAGQPELALASAQRVLDLDPAWAAARRLLGEAQLASGDGEAAVLTLTEHLDARPDDAAARLALARSLAETGRLEPALDEINVYLADKPEDREADSQRLEWFRATSREAEAAQLYASLAAARRDDAHVQYLAGLAHPDSEEGIAYLERAVSLDGSIAGARTTLARYRSALGRSSASSRRASAEPVLPVAPVETATSDPEPTPTPVMHEIVPVTVTPEPTPEPTATLASRFSEIRTAMENGSGAAAREALEKARAENGSDADAVRNLSLWAAILDFHEGQLDAAVAAFDKLDPTASYEAAGFGPGVIQNWQARANLAKGDVRGAIAVLDGVGRDDADEYATARLWEGVALASLGMTELAERTWQRVPEDVGTTVSASGQGALKSAQYLAGAISAKDYRTAVGSIAGFENDMHFVLGFQARRSDDVEVARAHFRKVIESSRGHEFPYDLAQAEVDGTGLTGEWPAD